MTLKQTWHEQGEHICVIGYGSLLDLASAQKTAPNLHAFELGYVEGYRRIFNKVGIAFFKLYPDLCHNSLEIASCATRADANSRISACAFEVSIEDFMAIYQREHRFRWIEVTFHGENGVRIGRMCTEYNDQDYRLNKCLSQQAYEQEVGQFYQGHIWRDDILPFPTYLAHCLQAAQRASQSMGEAFYHNFLHSSFLADNTTALTELLEQRPDYLRHTQSYTNR